MPSSPQKKNRRRLHCEALEPRLVLSSSAPFDPVLDLQVDAGVIFEPTTGQVSAWNDQAPDDNHLQSNGTARPTFGAVQTPTGLDAISFDGVDDRLLRDLNDPGGISGPPINDKDRSMFLVARFHDATVLGGATYGRGALNQAFGLGVGGPGADEGNIAVQGFAQNNDFYFDSEGFTSPGNSTGWMVLSLVHERDGFDPADNNWLYRDGVQVSAWSHNFNTKLLSTIDINGSTAARMVLGEGIKDRGNIEMDVAAWLVYDEALSASERGAVEGYLTATYLETGTNNEPVAIDDDVTIADGGLTTIDILANDTDSDGLIEPATVTIVTPPAHATSFAVDPSSGEVTYAHNGSGQTDSFTYRVDDTAGATSNIATVTVNISSDVLPISSGLVTWFETDSGVTLGPGSQVSSWLDGSETGLEILAAGNPQFVANATPSGQPAIAFDGAGDQLEISGRTVLLDLPEGADDRSVFIVANYLDAQGVQAGIAYGKPNFNRTFAVGVDGASGQLAVQGFKEANNLISTTPGEGVGWQLQSVVLSNNNLSHFESGVLVDSWTHVYQTRLDTLNTRLVLGRSIDSSGFSELEVAAVLIYDRALSASDRQQVEDYLANKYTVGSTSNLPPTANNDSYSTLVGGVINTTLNNLPSVLDNDTDPNFDTLNAVLVNGPSHGTLTLNPNGSFVYVHDGSSSADDSFSYRATDGTANSNVATVNIPISPVADGNSLVVRWHGDYYQHLWETGVPGGTQREFLENRWLRGGPPQGTQNSQQDLDLDNDGQLDDSRVYFDFSLVDQLNPQGTPARPNGVFYHTDMPSAEFYGGLSAEFLNYETNRFQQAFIENDGAGGELDDVGYPSPYLTPEFQGLSDYIELVRNDDGRPKKDHVGPHEDFAINLYRPDLPHPLNPQDNPADNLVTFHAAFIWKKEDFLAGGDNGVVSLDAESSISFESTRWWDNVGQARFILQSDNGQLYISQFSVAGALDKWGTTNELLDPLSTNWAIYAPATDDLDFDQSAASWINPITNNLFNNIQAVGIYVENDTPSGELTKFSLDEIRFNAVVTSNVSALAASPIATADVATFSIDGPVLASLPTQKASTINDTYLQTENLLDEATNVATVSFSPASDAAQDETLASPELQDDDDPSTDLQSLDSAFDDWKMS